MATLRNLNTGEVRAVEPEHLFGRAHYASARLTAAYTSAQHAALRWTGTHWVVRDLGSRNGTFVDGERLNGGEERPLQRGSKLAFGKPNAEAWELADDTAPPAMVVPVDGGDPILSVGDLLAVPSGEDPEVTLYRGPVGWLLERSEDATTSITTTQTFIAGGRTWRFCAPDESCQTSLSTGSLAQLEVRHLQLTFSVSRDEEHVSVRMTCGGRSVEIGARTHNYLLLTLARHRVEDTASGLPESSCGWVYCDQLTAADFDSQRLNLDVYRLRRHFAERGVVDAAAIIERRPRTRQLRIGTANLSIVRP
jgi:pSer/pThr/pTyr-binding forkhead associated (FHA) protein